MTIGNVYTRRGRSCTLPLPIRGSLDPEPCAKRLELLAKHYSLNAAGIVRMLVKERCDELVRDGRIELAPTPPTKKPRK